MIASSDADVALQERPITAAQRKSIEKWQTHHNLAHQALLACLAPEELTKVYQLHSVHEIWKRLADEYGPVSDFRRAQATSAFYSLQRKSSTSMQDHINIFTRLQQEVDYHRGNIPALTNTKINLTFLQSLSESWKTFQKSIGPRLQSISPSQLFGEVLAFDTQTHGSTAFNSDPLALVTRAQKPRTAYQSHYRSKPYDRSESQARKFCRFCKRKGHMIEDCLKKHWRDTQALEEKEETCGDSNAPFEWNLEKK
jgi:hypothetical protein